MLIQKLLKQQGDEHNNAYADERLRKCKNMLFEQRKCKAQEAQAKRDAQRKQM